MVPLVEFNTRSKFSMISSTYSAVQARFRPIIMTVLCMIFGMLPLMFSSGAGANGNSSLHVCLWEFHFRCFPTVRTCVWPNVTWNKRFM
ncbi:hypothetical protein DW982_06210 [Phocaeicola plebeius]|nr:hypothetical protein DW982_06210 [Phocaeicola plebeius]